MFTTFIRRAKFIYLLKFLSYFKDLDINAESLKLMTSSHLNEIIPRSMLGQKIVFEYHLKSWQKSEGVELDTLSNTSTSGSTLSLSSSFFDAVDELNQVNIFLFLTHFKMNIFIF